MTPNDVGDLLIKIIIMLTSISVLWFVYVVWLIIKSRQEFQEYFRDSEQKRLWWYINSELYKQFEFYETQLKLLVERDEETDFFVHGNLNLMVQVIDKQTGKVIK